MLVGTKLGTVEAGGINKGEGYTPGLLLTDGGPLPSYFWPKLLLARFRREWEREKKKRIRGTGEEA
jgi:hypothetical protein